MKRGLVSLVNKGSAVDNTVPIYLHSLFAVVGSVVSECFDPDLSECDACNATELFHLRSERA
jgi:hypothetical protein